MFYLGMYLLIGLLVGIVVCSTWGQRTFYESPAGVPPREWFSMILFCMFCWPLVVLLVVAD